MRFRILPPANWELREAVRFYEERVPGLGHELLEEFRATTARIIANPAAWMTLESSVRRCRMHRFPYGVIYSLEDGQILIVSVMHLHRHPQIWKRNLRN